MTTRTDRPSRTRRLGLTTAALAALLGGCTSSPSAPATAPAAAVDEATDTADEAAPDTPVAIELAEEVETVAVFLVRDPFRPVVSTATSGGGGGGNPTDPAPTNPSDPGSPAPSTPGDPSNPTDPAPGGGDDGCVAAGSGRVCDGELVELLDVRAAGGAEQADVRVDDNLYTVGEGDRFADSYLVQSIDPPCASFLHGDELFTLCEGQQVLK